MCKQKIPHSVKCLALKANEGMKIDTRGLDCIVKAKDNEIFIKAKKSEPDADAFPLMSGESIELAGEFTVFAKQDTNVYCLFYGTL